MTRFEQWLLAYECYVWIPFCQWLLRHPIIGSLAVLDLLIATIVAFLL